MTRYQDERPRNEAPKGASFPARAGQTFVIQAPLLGLTVTLPVPDPMSRSQDIWLISRSPNPVRVVCAQGRVNGAKIQTLTATGIYGYISDGESGWFTFAAPVILPGSVTNAMLASAPALTVLGRPVFSAGVRSDIPATGGTSFPLREQGGTLAFAAIVAASVTANTLTAATQAQMAANTIKSNATAALANESDLTVGTNTVVGRVAGNIVAAPLVNAQITANTITYASVAQPAANTIAGNWTAGAANLADNAVGASTFVARLATGNIVAATPGEAAFLLGDASVTSLTAVAVTTAQTNILSATYAASSLVQGAVIELYLAGKFNRGATATVTNVQLQVRAGGGVLDQMTAAALNVTNGFTGGLAWIRMHIPIPSAPGAAVAALSRTWWAHDCVTAGTVVEGAMTGQRVTQSLATNGAITFNINVIASVTVAGVTFTPDVGWITRIR